MYRYELRCRDCGITIGYTSLVYNPVDGDSVINRVQCGSSIEPICCPLCEVKRLQDKPNVQTKEAENENSN